MTDPNARDRTPSVSLPCVCALAVGVWLAGLIPFASPTSPRPQSDQSNLERLARSHGDGRTHRQILLGNRLVLAAEEGDVARVRHLLNAGADPNAREVRVCWYGWTPLEVASLGGHTDVVTLLLGHGADIALYGQGSKALAWAVRAGHPGVVQILRLAGVAGEAGTER